ncbi:MAG: TonB-dependent receptor, partial [Acidobacteriota bacterium]
VDGIEIIPGAFPAPYGDRGAAVVDLTTRVPYEAHTRAGISLTTASFSRGQRFGADDRGAGLVSLRRGWLDVVFDLVGDDEEGQEEGAPEYTDAFVKADWSVADRTTIGTWALWADDSLSSTETEDDGVLETIDSSYGNTWFVGYGQRLWNDASVAKARVFTGVVDRDRTASEAEGDSDFVVRDVRQLDVTGVAADASFDLGSHLLDVGFEARSYSSQYDYVIDREFTNPVAGVGESVEDSFFDDTIEGESYAVWASDRWRLSDRLVAEAGVRYDRQTWLAEDDDQVSPRLALVADLGEAGVLRGGWGLAHQSHRPNELSVEDGDTTFALAEKAEHRIVGWERPFDRWRLRVDAWERLGSDLRPRYANLFSPSVLFPEGTPDRIRIDADRSRARGVELFAQGRGGQRATWWASYAWSEVEDRIDGTWVPRAIDQTHALTLSAGFRLGRNWNLDTVWQYHTGWPITGLTAQLVDGDDGPEIEPILGTLYGERVADYHRLDVRLSRTYTLDWAEMQFYVDVQNLYNQENERGFEYTEDDFLVQPDGSVLVTPTVDTWLGIVPSFGLTWSF